MVDEAAHEEEDTKIPLRHFIALKQKGGDDAQSNLTNINDTLPVVARGLLSLEVCIEEAIEDHGGLMKRSNSRMRRRGR